jgi:hypothetical protein
MSQSKNNDSISVVWACACLKFERRVDSDQRECANEQGKATPRSRRLEKFAELGRKEKKMASGNTRMDSQASKVLPRVSKHKTRKTKQFE